MAIISIPSSIGGVSIPGLGGLIAKGPLKELFGNKGFANHQYPRDLGSATRGHYIQFYINEVQESQFATTAQNGIAGAKAFLEDPSKAIQNATAPAANIEKASTATANVDNTPKKRALAHIALYMPETMAFTYNTPYDDTSLLEVAQEGLSAMSSMAGAAANSKGIKNAKIKAGLAAVGGFAGGAAKLLTSAPKSGGVRLLAKGFGLAINPQKQLLFQGIGFRDYQLVFTFTPYSKDESKEIEAIIKEFKMAAAPAITSSAGGMFFKVPKTFQVEFMFNGQENKKISKVTDSVLTTIDVNYSPNTFAAMDDGSPVQIMLTLNFKEINLVDRTLIEKGY
jgi:hypothetical protein